MRNSFIINDLRGGPHPRRNSLSINDLYMIITLLATVRWLGKKTPRLKRSRGKLLGFFLVLC